MEHFAAECEVAVIRISTSKSMVLSWERMEQEIDRLTMGVAAVMKMLHWSIVVKRAEHKS